MGLSPLRAGSGIKWFWSLPQHQKIRARSSSGGPPDFFRFFRFFVKNRLEESRN